MIWNVQETQRRLQARGLYHGRVDGIFGRDSWAALLAAIARRSVNEQDRALGTHFPKALAEIGMGSPLVIAHFLAQLAVESGGFVRLEENLNYSGPRLMAVWPSRFPTLEATKAHAHNPKALANKVYGGRHDLGNGPVASGDGWRYRGRGLIQLTGRANYAERAKQSGLPLIDQPELAADPKYAVMIAARYWQSRNLSPLAEQDALTAIRKRINGGTHGLQDAKTYLARAKALLM